MTDCYTVLSFAPVQGFIEKSRKLRDLFGSSYLLSFLSWAVCHEIERSGCTVISPALSNVTQGMPNQIVVRGQFPIEGGYDEARAPLDRTWRCIVEACQTWIESHPKLKLFQADFRYWERDWNLWKNHAWEFFWVAGAPGESISDVRDRLNDIKRSRNWTGINWVGESSTLSGADAIAYPKLGAFNPRTSSYRDQEQDIKQFYEALSKILGESFVTPDEQLSIPELVKRMVTREEVAEAIVSAYASSFPGGLEPSDRRNLIAISHDLRPDSFRDLNRERKDEKNTDPKYWTGWFLGDGDRAGNYLKSLDSAEEAQKLEEFSSQMRKWGCIFRHHQDAILPSGRVIYAGGDDFMGVLYGDYPDRPSRQKASLEQIQPYDCLEWLSTFKSQVWDNPAWDEPSDTYRLPLDILTPRQSVESATVSPKPITVSVGFVWASPNVPQRDVLQHCREAEQSAKQGGRDRLALRVLFNGGNHLEWVCPWWLLEGDFSQLPRTVAQLDKPASGLIAAYRDRADVDNADGDANWTHFYNDIAVLESRHAFQGIEVALGLLEIYFGKEYRTLLEQSDTWWNIDAANGWERHFSGILGDPNTYTHTNYVTYAFNAWVINLAKIGFHLHRDVSPRGAIAA